MTPRILSLLAAATLVTACNNEPSSRSDTGDDATCDPGHIADRGSCVPEACGTGTWGDLEVDESTVYVDIGAEAGGDGTEERPLTSIQAGLDLAGSRGGGMVAVASGSYPETLAVTTDHAGVHLAGRCKEFVILDASVGDSNTPGMSIQTQYGALDISGLTVTGSNNLGMYVGSGVVRLVEVKVEESAYVGIGAHRASLAAPTELTLEHCELTRNTGTGISIKSAGILVQLIDTTIQGTQTMADGTFGYGIEAGSGASVEVVRCVLESNTDMGTMIQDEGTQALFSDTVIRNTLPIGILGDGIGIGIRYGAALVMEGCRLEGNSTAGLVAGGTGTQVVLDDTVIEGTQCAADGTSGGGVNIYGGAALEASCCDLNNNRSTGICLGDYGTEATLQDVLVRNTRTDEQGQFGYGIDVNGGTVLGMERCELVGNTMVGILAREPGTRIALKEAVISNTLPGGRSRVGVGIVVKEGANLSAVDCSLISNTGTGLFAIYSGTQVELRDTSIEHTMTGLGEQGAVGIGLLAQGGASVRAYGLQLEDNEGPGIYAVNEGTEVVCSGCSMLNNQFSGAAAIALAHLELVGSTIAGGRPSANLDGGVGVFSSCKRGCGPTTVIVDDTTITDNTLAGIYLHGEGSYTVTRSEISGSTTTDHGASTRCGDGIYAESTVAWNGNNGLLLQDNVVSDNQGVGLFLDDGHTLLEGNSWDGNEHDLLIQGEACLAPLVSYSTVPDPLICPEWDRPTCPLEFVLDLEIADISGETTQLVPPASTGIRRTLSGREAAWHHEGRGLR